jgi:hypothetical protein
MAQRREIQLIDDLDGGPADTTVSFAIDGTSYEIDLSAAHAEEVRSALQPYIAVARTVSGSARRTGAARRSGSPSAAAVREWAKAEGITVSGRGRVPAQLVASFREAADAGFAAGISQGWDEGDRPRA